MDIHADPADVYISAKWDLALYNYRLSNVIAMDKKCIKRKKYVMHQYSAGATVFIMQCCIEWA